MATKKFCDRCEGKIAKLPGVIKANDREAELCNDCWSDFVKFMGYPFYTTQLKRLKSKSKK